METQKFTSTPLVAGERVNIHNPRSTPVKAIVSGFGCGGQVEIGLTGGQFFTIVSGTSALTVKFLDITNTELQHPGSIISAELPDKMH